MLKLRSSISVFQIEAICFSNKVHVRQKQTVIGIHKVVKKITVPSIEKKGLSHSHLSQVLQECDCLASQIEAFDSHVKLPKEDVSHRQEVCETLSKAMKDHFPQSSICLMGSSITGLGMKGCDMDLSFQFNSSEHQNDPSFSPKVALSKDIEEGKVPTSVIPFLPPKQQLRFIRKALSDCGLIDKASPIVPGKCPILNFSYSNLICDLAINNKPALQGALLMLLCRKLDSRVAPLFRMISYWGKHLKFVGGPTKFKSYGIFLLLLYFLQTRSPPILPPVQIMLEKADILKNAENLSWDISKYLQQFDASKNSQSLEELLKEFFFFYGNFNFDTVISPFTSQLIDRHVFLTSNASEEDAFLLSTISIQDPLDLSWNVASGVTWKYNKLFIRGLLSSCISYHEDPFKPTGNRTWGLLSLFDALKTNDATMTKPNSVCFKVPLLTEGISEAKEQCLQIAAENIMKIFQYCLNFETFNPEEKASQLVIDNLKQQSTLFQFCFQCVESPTWTNRSNLYKPHTNESQSDILENEHNISLKMCEYRNNPAKDSKNNFQFICECSGVCDEQENIQVLVHLKALSGDVFNPKLALFLKNYVPKLYVKMFSR